MGWRIPEEWAQYIKSEQTTVRLLGLQGSMILRHVDIDVLGTTEVAAELGNSIGYVRRMFADPSDLPPEISNQGGKFTAIEIGEYRKGTDGRPAPAAYVITRRMLEEYVAVMEVDGGAAGLLPVKHQKWEAIQIFSLQGAADTFTISVNRLRKAIGRGQLRAKRVGPLIVLAYDVLRFLATPPEYSSSRAQFTDAQVLQIRAWRSTQHLTLPQIQQRAAQEFGVEVDKSSLSRLVSGHSYSHL